MRKSFLSITGILVLAGILLLLNAVARQGLRSAYVDLTEEGLYTLSQGTKNIIGSIKDPITLRFYFSKTDSAQFPGIKLYASRVVDLLREYERNSAGKINFEYYDPRPDSEEEEWAQKYGLTPLQLQTGERLFFGLAGINSLGEEAAIPLFNLGRQEFLEYDVSKLIFSLVNSKKPVVGILSSLPVKGAEASPMARLQGQTGEEQPWFFVAQLHELADVRYLETNVTAIADDVDTLLVIHPKGLTDKTLYALDQFVLRGGNLLVFVDPYCQAERPPTNPANPMQAMIAERDSNLNRLLAPWGAELLVGKAVGDINLATKVNSGRGGPVRDFVLWLTLGAEQMNRENVVTSALDNVLLPWPGALKISPVDGITTETLFTTTPDAMLLDQSEYRIGGGNPDELLRNYVRGTEPQILAVRLSGKFKTTFPEGEPKDDSAPQESTMPGASHLAESADPSNVVVVSDVDLLSDPFSVSQQSIFGRRLVTPLNDNLVFVLNMVENLAGSNDLISIRSRGRFSRPFTKVQEIEARAQSRWQQEEAVLQAKLNAANQRLSQLQSSTGGSEEVFSTAVLDEIKKFREERKETQQTLREVRLRLREDKERLGSILFALNTFLVPVVLIIGTLIVTAARRKRKGEPEAHEQ